MNRCGLCGNESTSGHACIERPPDTSAVPFCGHEEIAVEYHCGDCCKGRIAKLERDFTEAVSWVQRLQPAGSPCPGGRVMLTGWIVRETLDKIKRLERENEALKANVARYLKAFKHVHTAGEKRDIDRCAECGLDLRDEIHRRLEES